MELQEKIWDKIANKWEDYRQMPLPSVKKFLENKEGKIVDLACGSGRHFCKTKGKIYGVDFSSKMLIHADKKAKKLKVDYELTRANILDLPFDNDFFDYGIFISGLHCLEGKVNREHALEELYRVLKKGGGALITVWSNKQKRVKNKSGDVHVPWTVEEKKLERYYYIYSIEELKEELEKVGFKVLNIKEESNIIVEVEKS